MGKDFHVFRWYPDQKRFYQYLLTVHHVGMFSSAGMLPACIGYDWYIFNPASRDQRSFVFNMCYKNTCVFHKECMDSSNMSSLIWYIYEMS